jgi:hypothetical protein
MITTLLKREVTNCISADFNSNQLLLEVKDFDGEEMDGWMMGHTLGMDGLLQKRNLGLRKKKKIEPENNQREHNTPRRS